jgi:FMN-dependent dehydrogenase
VGGGRVFAAGFGTNAAGNQDFLVRAYQTKDGALVWADQVEQAGFNDTAFALALGARVVLIGRPVFWGLAVAGETGVRRVLEMLRDELDAMMGMCGRTTVASVDRACLVGVSPLLALFPPATPFR